MNTLQWKYHFSFLRHNFVFPIVCSCLYQNFCSAEDLYAIVQAWQKQLFPMGEWFFKVNVQLKMANPSTSLAAILKKEELLTSGQILKIWSSIWNGKFITFLPIILFGNSRQKMKNSSFACGLTRLQGALLNFFLYSYSFVSWTLSMWPLANSGFSS